MENTLSLAGVAVLGLLGLVHCFFGYRFFKALLSIAGALIFGFLLAYLSFLFMPELLWLRVVTGLIGAFFGAWLFHLLYRWALFMLGMSVGAMFTPAVISLLKLEVNWHQWLAGLVLVLAFGILTQLVQRMVLIVITSLYGSQVTATATILLLSKKQFFTREDINAASQQAAGWIAGVLILAMLGIIVQARQKHKEK